MAFDFASVTASFFDAKAVTDKLDPAVRKALAKFGAFVRQTAKQSIKRRKGTAPAGSPPFAHEGSIRKIYFSYDAKSNSVVVGPILAGPSSGAPETLEYGGFARVDGKRVKVSKHPFMTPAFDKELGKVGNDFKNLIK